MTDIGILDLDDPNRVPIDVTHHVDPAALLAELMDALGH